MKRLTSLWRILGGREQSVALHPAPQGHRADVEGLGGPLAVPAEAVARWGTGRALYNGYGPAEATVFATCSAPLTPGDTPVIGHPVRGVAAVVLDDLTQFDYGMLS